MASADKPEHYAARDTRKKSRSLAIALVCTLVALVVFAIFAPRSAAQLTASTPVFGPQTYVRTTGAPNEYTTTFTAPSWITSPYDLHIVNGAANGSNRISSGTITLNGVQIVGPSDFNQNVATIDRSVTLQASNSLQITLASKPGSYITINVYGTSGDHTPPQIDIVSPSNNGYINTATPSFEVTYSDPVGSGDSGASGVNTATFKAVLDGVDRTSLFTTRSGDASATLPANLALSSGAHTLVVTLQDNAGNQATATSTFNVDLGTPQIQITQPVLGAYIKTATPTITIQYSDSVGLNLPTLQVLINGVDETSLFTKTNSGATATLPVANALPSGANQITAQIKNLAGTSATASTSFNVDTTAPLISITHPAANSYHGSPNIDVAVQYSDDQAINASSLQVTLDGVAVTMTTTPNSATGSVANVATGAHVIVATIADMAGNLTTTQENFYVDLTVPDIHILQPPSGGFLNTHTPQVSIEYSDVQGVNTSTFQVLVNGVDATSLFSIQSSGATATLSGSFAFVDGSNSITALITNLAGTVGSTTGTFQVDTIPPSISFQAPPAQTSSSTPTVIILYSDSGSGVNPFSLKVSLDGADVSTLIAPGPNSATGVLQVSPVLTDGTHQLSATVADLAGNVSSPATLSFVVDTKPPVVTLTPANNSFLNSSTPSITVQYNDGNGTGVNTSTLHVQLQQGANPPVDISDDFQIAAQQATGAIPAGSPLNDGTYTLTAMVSDAVGNVGSASSTFEIDTVPPLGIIQAPAANAIFNTSAINVIITYSDDRSGVDTTRIALTVDGVNQTPSLTVGPSQASGTLPTLPDGAHNIQLTVYDRAGNASVPVSQTFTIDTSIPTIQASISPSPNAAGWNNTPVTITYSCADTESGVATCPSPVSVTAEGANQQFCANAVSNSGNISLPACPTVNLDETPPVITYSVAPSPNSSGIITSVPVTISFACTDGLSGVKTCAQPITINNPGLNQSFNVSATDNAGNTAQLTVTVSIQIPSTSNPPSIVYSITPPPNAKGWNNSPVTVTFTCTPGSNPLANCTPPSTVTTEGQGQSVCGTALDSTGLTAHVCAPINLDLTPPTISATVSPQPNGSNWNNSPVTVSFACSDNLSGVTTCGPTPQTISSEGAGQSVTGNATDVAGNNAPADKVTINIELTPPSILSFTAPSQLAPGQSGTATVAANSLSGITAIVFQLNGSTVGTLNAASGTITFSAPTTANPGDTLQLTVSVSDAAGNANSSSRGIQVVPPGVVTGQVLADATGLPLADANVQVLGGSTQTASGDDGRYSIQGTTPHFFLSVNVPANASAGTPAMVSVEREVYLQVGVGTVPVDARMTSVSTPVQIPAAGGSLTSGNISVAVPAGAVSSATNFYLTSLSQQGLPGLLPLGWSPVSAVDVRSDGSSSATLNATIAQLPSSVTMYLVQYSYSTHAWAMVAPNLTAQNGSLALQIPSLGDFALIVPDAGGSGPAIPSPGQPLTSVAMVTLPSGAAATGSLNPPSVSPAGGTSQASLAVQSSVPLPSGTVIQASVQGSYKLNSGEQLADAKRSEDILVYQYSAPSGAAGVATFPVTPMQTFSADQFSSGDIHLDILSGRESIRGQVGGSDAVTVTGGGATLTVGANSLRQDTAISVASEPVDSFLPSTSSLIALAEYNLDFSGQTLTAPAQLAVAAGSAQPGNNVLLCQVQIVSGVRYLVAVSLAQVNGSSLVTQGGPGFSGITQGGDYVFYKVASPLGFVSGTLTPASVPAIIQTDGMPFVVWSGASGAYLIPAIAGTVNLTASIPNTALAGNASVQVTAGQTANANITLVGQIESATVTPANGAVGVPLTAEIDITAPDAINQTTVTATSVTLTQTGQGAGTSIPVNFVFSQGGTRLSVFPQSALQPSTSYTLSATGIANALGGLITVPTVTFTTLANTPPAFNPNAIVFAMPDQNGNVAVSAPANSFPPGTTVLIVDQTNGVVLSLTVANDGSLTGTMPATIDDVLAVTVTAPDKTTASFTVSQFVAADGTTAVGPGGGTVTGPGGTGMIIPAGALNKGVTFKLALLDQTAFPQLPSWPNVNFGSGMQITAPAMPTFNSEVKLAFPVPPNAPSGAFYYVFRKVTDQNGNVYFETIDEAFVQGTGASAQVVTASPPFCGYRNSFGSFQQAATASFIPLASAIIETFMLWDFDPNQPGVSSPGLVLGNVFQSVPPGPGQTSTQFAPIVGQAKVTLTDYPQFFAYSTGQCSTFTIFDALFGGGTRRINAQYNGQEIDTTVDEVSGVQPDDNLFSVTAGLEKLYRNIGRVNFTFQPPTPPPAPPQLSINVSTIDPSGNPQPIQGIAQINTPLLFTFSSANNYTLVGVSVNGNPFSTVIPDASTTPPAGFTNYKSNAYFVATQPGLYTVFATALPVFGGNSATASSSFLVVAGGGGNSIVTPGVAPSIISNSPANLETQVPVTVFPNVIFSEPVSNVPANVSFGGNGLPGTSYVLIGIRADNSVANPVSPTDWITALTIQPLQGLEYGATYYMNFNTGIIDQNKDANGNPLHLQYTSFTFTTAAYQQVGFTPDTNPFAATRAVVFGQRAYFGEIVNPSVSGLDIVNITDPTLPYDEGVQLSFPGRAMDAAGEQSFQYQDYSADPNNPTPKTIPLVALAATVGSPDVPIPSNIWLYDVSSPDKPTRLAGVSATSSAISSGSLLRIVAKGQYIYASTFLQGLQVIDLQQAIQDFQTTSVSQAGIALSSDGQGFALDAVVNTIPVPITSCVPNSQPCTPVVVNKVNETSLATMWDLKAGDFATSYDPNNPTTPASTQTLLVATGQLPLVVADPTQTATNAFLYPPKDSFGTGLNTNPIVSSDSSFQFTEGRAVTLGTIPLTNSSGNTTEQVAVLVGTGIVTSFGVPSGDGILVVVNMANPRNPVPQGFLDFGYGVYPTDIVLNGTFAYVGTASGNVLLVNLNDPTQPLNVGQIKGDFGDRLALTSLGYIVTTSANPAIGGLEIGAISTTAVRRTKRIITVPPNPPKDCEQSGGDPVDFATGNSFVTQSDFSIPGLGATHLTRTWNSQYEGNDPVELVGTFGNSWRSNFDERLVFDTSTSPAQTAQYWRGNGGVWNFIAGQTAGSYAISAPMNEHATIQVDPNTQIATMTFYNGTARVFNPAGYLTAIIDRNGNQTTIAYDSSNRITKVTDPANRVLTFNYSTLRQVQSIQDSVGVMATYTYDTNNRLTKVAYPDGSSVNMAYDLNDLLTVITDGSGKVMQTFNYDSNRRAVSLSQANGTGSLNVQYTNDTQTQVTNSKGQATTYYSGIFGGRYAITSLTGPGCGDCGGRGNSTFTYDANGNRTSKTDALGVSIQLTYDSNGNVLTRTVSGNGPSATWSFTYNNFGEVLTSVDPLGNTTTNTYDAHGNLLTTTIPSPTGSGPGSTSSVTYDSKGQPLTVTDALGNKSSATFNAAGLVASRTDPQGNTAQFFYDARGNRTSMVDPFGKATSFVYDARNRVTQITYPDGTTVRFAYDQRGRRTSITDPGGTVSTYAYNDADQVTSVSGPAGHTTSYTYDSEANLTSITDPNNNTTSYTYDSLDHVTAVTYPSGLAEHLNYDSDDNLLSKTDRNGNTITYTYDGLNRLVQKTYPDQTSVNYVYDSLNRLAQVSDSTGTYAFSYNSQGKLSQAQTSYSFLPGKTFTTSYTYDAASNLTGMVDPQGGLISYVYNPSGEPSSITTPEGTFALSYDALGRRTGLSRPNGVASTYAYDALSRLASVQHQLRGTTFDGASYTLSPVGFQSAKLNLLNNSSETDAYDAVYELTGVTRTAGPAESYSYDQAGNRLNVNGSAAASYNASEQLVSDANATYTYDNNGNLLTKTDSTGTTKYTWDFENRLSSITLPNGVAVSFKYDPLGRRIYKSSSSSGTHVYVYSGVSLIEEVDGSGNSVAAYRHGVGIDEPLAENRGGAVYYYEADSTGSVTSLTDSSGALAATYVYDSYGNLISSAGSVANPFLFTGREFDSETGLYYYRARYYDPRLGRFLSADRVWPIGGNPYSYALNNPLTWIDPLGMCFSFDDRVRLFRKGLADFFFGVTKVGVAVAVGVGTGGVGAVITVYEGYQGVLETANGINKAASAFFDPKGAERRSAGIETAESVTGVLVYLGTGSTEQGSFATSLEKIAIVGGQAAAVNAAQNAIEIPSILNVAQKEEEAASTAVEAAHAADNIYDKGDAAYNLYKAAKDNKKAPDCNCN